MPVSVESLVSGPFTPNGVTTAFPFTFKAVSADEVVVVDQDGETLSTALYSVTLNSGEGGTVTFSIAPVLADYTELYVVGDPAMTQPADFDNAGPSFNPAAITRAFDRAAVRDLKLSTAISRAISVPFGEAGFILASSSDRANAFLAFDPAGEPFMSSGTGADAGLRTDLANDAGAALVGVGNGRSVAGMFALNNYSAIQLDNTAAENRSILNAEVAALSAAGGGVIHLLPHSVNEFYPFDGTLEYASNVTIVGVGGKVELSGDFYMAGENLTNIGAEGLIVTHTSGIGYGQQCYRFEYVDGLKFKSCEFRKVPAAGGYIGVCYAVHNVVFDDYKMSGSNGVIINGRNWRIVNWEANSYDAGDDCWTVKAPYNGPAAADVYSNSEDITIGIGTCNGYVSPLSIGSEIGTLAANATTDAMRRHARNINMLGVTARNCQSLLFIKPGANAGNDYRDGLVSGVTVGNCSLEDETGSSMVAPVYIWAGRGARVERVFVDTVTCKGRAYYRGTEPAAIKIETVRYPGGTDPSLIDGVYVSNFTFEDPHEGFGYTLENGGSDGVNMTNSSVTVDAVPHTLSFRGAGSIALSGAYSGNLAGVDDDTVVSLTFTPTAGTLNLTVTSGGGGNAAPRVNVANLTHADKPGFPFDYAIYAYNRTENTGTIGTIGRIEFDRVRVNGLRRSAVNIGPDVASPIVRDCEFTNFARGNVASLDRGAFTVESPVQVRGRLIARPHADAPSPTRPVMADAWESKQVRIHADRHEIDIGSLAAGNIDYRTFSTDRPRWISRVELVNRQAIAADGTNYVTVAVTNRSTNNNIVSANTNTGFVLAANTPVSIGGANQFSGDDSLLPAGKVLEIFLQTHGSAALSGAKLVIYSTPYDEPA